MSYPCPILLIIKAMSMQSFAYIGFFGIILIVFSYIFCQNEGSLMLYLQPKVANSCKVSKSADR